MKKFIVPFLIFTLSLGFNEGCFTKNNEYQKSISKNSQLQQLSSMKFKDIDNNTISLKNYKGYPVIFIFFSTECPACIRESQYLSELYRESNGNVKIVGFNLDIPQDQEKILYEFRKDLDIAYPIVPYSSKVEKAISILNVYTQSDFIPQTFIFDKHGNLRFYNVGFSPKVGEKISEAINSLEKEK